MNPLDEQLNRLFRAAELASFTTEAPAFGLEARVLAAARTGSIAPMWNTRTLAYGLILASAIMTVSLWPALSQKNNSDSTYLQLADSSIDYSP